MSAYNKHMETAYTHLLASIFLPTLLFSTALLLSDSSSPSTQLSLIAFSCILPLTIHTTIYSRLSFAKTQQQITAQPRASSCDLLWVLPAALYASVSTLQRYFMVAIYEYSVGAGYNSSKGVIRIVYMLGVMEWTTVSQLSVMLWREARESEDDFENFEPAKTVEIPRIVVTILNESGEALV